MPENERETGIRLADRVRDLLLKIHKSNPTSEMMEKAIVATRQLCKRQCTWLRNEKEALVLTNPNIDKAIDYIK